MHSFALFILAADDDFPMMPVFIAVVFIIWIVIQAISSASRAKTKSMQGQQRRLQGPIQIPAIAQANPRLAKMPIPAKRNAKRRPPPLPRQRSAQQRQPEPIMMTVAEPELPPQAPAKAHTATPSAMAIALHGWLSPQTMRKQFILTEILQPPLALREDQRLL